MKIWNKKGKKGKRKNNLANFGNVPNISEAQNNARNDWINNGVINEHNRNLKILLPLDATVIKMQAGLPMKGLELEQRLYRTTLRLPVLPRVSIK